VRVPIVPSLITKIITPAAGSATMTQWVTAGVTDLSMFRFAAPDAIQSAMVVEEAINRTPGLPETPRRNRIR
jgi:hypothetical protein